MKIENILKAAGCEKEKGQILVWTSLMIVILLGFLALAMDGGFFYQHKRQMQTAADSAALAGAHEIKRDPTISQGTLESSARNDSNLNGFAHGSNNVDVAINRPPLNGFYAGNNSYVEAIVTHPHRTFFARILNLLGPGINFNTATVSARAVAGSGTSQDCIYVLHPTANKAFEISSNTTVNADCGVQVNSSNNKDALSVTSGSYLTATSIDVTGNVENSSPGDTITPVVNTGAAPETDPLAGLSPPTYGSSCDQTGIGSPPNRVLVEGTKTLSPGVYCGGIELNSANVTFSPGIYILKGGGLKVKSGSTVTGTGVAFYNTGTSTTAGPVSIESNSSVQLRAPESGQMAGMLFYQDRSIGLDNPSLDANIASDINSAFTGAFYFPNNELRFHSGTSTNNGADWTVIVARTLEVSSNTTLKANAKFSSVPNPLLAKVRLVE